MLVDDYDKIAQIASKRGLRPATKDEIRKLGLSERSRYYLPANAQRITSKTPVITRRRYERFTKGFSFELAAKIRRGDFRKIKTEKLEQIKRERTYYHIYTGKGITKLDAVRIIELATKSIADKFGRKVVRYYLLFENGVWFSTGMVYSGDLNAVRKALEKMFSYGRGLAKQENQQSGKNSQQDEPEGFIIQIDVSIES